MASSDDDSSSTSSHSSAASSLSDAAIDDEEIQVSRSNLKKKISVCHILLLSAVTRLIAITNENRGVRGPDNFVEEERRGYFRKCLRNVRGLDDGIFRRKFRLTKEEANFLIINLFPRDYSHNGRVSVPKEIQLLLALRYLAGGSYLDIADLYTHNISSTLYYILHRVIGMINGFLKIHFPSLLEARELTNEFTLPGCVGCVDGLLIPIQCPPGEAPVAYYTRKGFYALNCQAVAGPNGEFMYVSCQWTGPTSDSTAFQSTSLALSAEAGQVPALMEDRFLVADAAYPIKKWLMKPFDRTGAINSDPDIFNYVLSSSRVSVERAFGMLTQRWRCLNIANGSTIDHIRTYLQAACRLHNFCIRRILKEGYIDAIDEDNDADHMRIGRITRLETIDRDRRNAVPPGELINEGAAYNDGCERRRALMNYLVAHGYRRPVIV